jgi:hypothetical protein
MRMPVRSEQDAFFLVFLCTAVACASVLLGYLVAPLVGVAVIALAALGALLWELTSDDPRRGSRLHDAEQAGREVAGGHRILLIANATPIGKAVRDAIVASCPHPALEVLAPVLQSRTHFLTTDIDRETEQARIRLSETLAWARSQGLRATGMIGDPIDPLAGIADELRRFDVDEVVIATHPLEQANWLEPGMLTSLRNELDVPVRHIVVEPRERRALDGDHASAMPRG